MDIFRGDLRGFLGFWGSVLNPWASMSLFPWQIISEDLWLNPLYYYPREEDLERGNGVGPGEKPKVAAQRLPCRLPGKLSKF